MKAKEFPQSNLTRRKFGLLIGLSSLAPLVFSDKAAADMFITLQDEEKISYFEKKLNRKLSDDEEKLAETFLKQFDESMARVREAELSFDTLPAFIPEHPPKKASRNVGLKENNQ